jgi:guanosine-3',5'-bis(diphosphate) 3'-pyrophosphohydrolase
VAEPRYPRLHDAIRWAAKLHKGQDRDGKDPLPYICHPMDVLAKLREIGGVTDEDLLCVAVLHDTIEECNADPNEIEDRFGKHVRELVVELTREEPSSEVRAKLSETELYELRNQMLLSEISKMGREAQIVKLADRLSNMSESLRSRSGVKLERYVNQTSRILEIIPRDVNPALWDAVQGARDQGLLKMKS